MRKVRNVTRENLFEKWLDEVVRPHSGPYDYAGTGETFAAFSKRVTGTVPGSAGDQGGTTEPAR